MTTWAEHVLPHSDLIQLAPRLWTVTGSLPHMSMPRNMMIYKLGDGTLWIHSCIALNDAVLAKLEALGPIGIVVVPNSMHRLDALVYKERFPKALILCPAAAKTKVAEKVEVDGTCEEVLPRHGIICHYPKGTKKFEIVYELDAGDGKALVMTDLLFNLPHLPGIKGIILKLIGSTGFFGMTGIGKMMLLKNKAELSNWLQQLAGLSGLRIIAVGHGDMITKDAANLLKQAAERLR